MFNSLISLGYICYKYKDLFEAVERFINYCQDNDKTYGFVKQCIDNWEISLENYIKECEKYECNQ